MEERRERRLFLECPIVFEGNQGVSQGKLFNISIGGGAIQSETSVQTGAMLTLRVHLPSLKQPIEVSKAEVTWTAGEDFGVQFLQLGSEERDRLNQVVEDLIRGIRRHQAHQIPDA